MSYHFTSVRMALINKSTNKCWQRMWRKGNTFAPLVGMPIGAVTMESSMEIHQKLENGSVFLKNIFYWLCYYSCPIIPLYSPLPCTYLSPAFPTFRSCPWVIHRSFLASTFPILFLTSPCLFCTYHLCYLFSVPFPPSPSHSLLITLHVISISVILFLF